MADDSVPELRLTDAERDNVVARLGQAMSEGRIDVSEFEARSRQAYGAKVPSDLEGVLDGLPPFTPAVQAATPARTAAQSGNRWFFSLLGDQVRRGAIDLRDTATSISVLGDTTFDLTQITVEQVNLRIFSALGDVTVLVRSGTTVDANVFLILGDRKEDVAPATEASSMHVRLRIAALMGDVKIVMID